MISVQEVAARRVHRAAGDERLDEGFRVPWWTEGEEVPVALAFTETEGNMSFCSGQVFQIQVLGGCREADRPFRDR